MKPIYLCYEGGKFISNFINICPCIGNSNFFETEKDLYIDCYGQFTCILNLKGVLSNNFAIFNVYKVIDLLYSVSIYFTS